MLCFKPDSRWTAGRSCEDAVDKLQSQQEMMSEPDINRFCQSGADSGRIT